MDIQTELIMLKGQIEYLEFLMMDGSVDIEDQDYYQWMLRDLNRRIEQLKYQRDRA